MSRLIVKNIPAHVTPERLREHFTRRDGPGGTLTDVKVARKRDGTSRCFGFVGFKTDAEAAAAQRWFDRTFIGSARISVEIVDGAKDAPAPRPNKRPRIDASLVDNDKHVGLSEATVRPHPTKTLNEGGTSQLDEFMRVMKPRTKKGASWANEDASSEVALPVTSSSAFTPSMTHTSVVARERNTEKKSKAPEELTSEESANVMQTDGTPQEGMSDLDWMKKRMSQAMDLNANEERVFEQSDDDATVVDSNEKEETLENNPTKTTILETARLFVRNLTFSCTGDELQDLFTPYGNVTQVHMPLDSQTKKPKGLAYITFSKPDDALAAYEALDKKSFQGRLLHILAAVDRNGKAKGDDGDGRKKSVKEERTSKRKADAGRAFNWGMLYMSSDAVVSSIADRMNISKADILNPDGSANAAVKLALAETHVITETKSYLSSQGIDLDAFGNEQRRPRSDTVILVKNIPYGTSAEQIREMFVTHGELTRVLVPPAGTMAIVEFKHPGEASVAFRAVAYRRLGNSVIYLEKAPVGLFKSAPLNKPDTLAASIIVGGPKPVHVPETAKTGDTTNGGEESLPLSAGSTLFIKNLSFATTSERLSAVFQHLPSFAFARVQTKPDPHQPGGTLSAGYGFVGFRDVGAAQSALKGMHGFILDGHALAVSFAGRGADDGEGKKTEAARKGTTKMIVKNVPFEATKKDLRELFGAHGQLKSVRLPKKFDRRSRGFAFLEFLTRQEADNAYETLRHTHLLGRHLVLEWATEGEQDLDMLRQKAGVGYGGGKELPGRKRKLDMDGEGGEDGEDYE